MSEIPPMSDPDAHCEPDPRDIEKLVQEVYEEAEVIPHETGMVVRHETGLATVAELEQQFALAVRQRELLSDYIRKHLIPGKHFYEIQGNKPSLTKEGAEIILLPHNLAPDYEIVSGPTEPTEEPYQITVKCILRRKGDPASFVGSAIGSSGSHKRDKQGNYNPRQTDKYLCHNATLKMAEKSAMIAATLNSTAGSEFFTQDMDDAPTSAPEPPRRAAAPRPPDTRPPPPKAPAAPKPPPPRVATDTTRAWMAQQLEPCMQEALRYFIEAGVILPTETIDDVPLRFVPVNKVEMIKLVADITHFAINGRLEGKPVEHVVPQTTAKEVLSTTGKPVGIALKSGFVPFDAQGPDEGDYDLDQWPFTCIIPIPRKGMKRDDYLKNPDTIGSLFELRHGTDEESAAARQRLWGFIHHFESKTWVDRQGQTRMPSKADVDFRKALDLLADMLEKKGDKI